MLTLGSLIEGAEWQGGLDARRDPPAYELPAFFRRLVQRMQTLVQSPLPPWDTREGSALSSIKGGVQSCLARSTSYAVFSIDSKGTTFDVDVYGAGDPIEKGRIESAILDKRFPAVGKDASACIPRVANGADGRRSLQVLPATARARSLRGSQHELREPIPAAD